MEFARDLAASESLASSRREFLRLAAAFGLLGPAVVAGGGTAAHAGDPSPAHPPLGPKYLAQGLAAMSDAHRRGWVAGHLGAAVLSSHYFCKENGLDERTSRALEANVDAFIAQSPKEFPSPDPGRGKADPALIIEKLDGQISKLRSGGHNVIYASLAVRALRDLPDFATPAVVDGICRLLDVFATAARPIPDTRHNIEQPLPPYRAAGDLAAVTLRAMLRPWSHVREVGASGVVHWVTHAEALVTLEELGYGEVARRGHAAQQLQINRPVTADDAPAPDRAPIDWLGPAYWESAAPRKLLRDSWLFGHSFKLPYSLFRLLRCIDDQELRNACLARASKLTIPFE